MANNNEVNQLRAEVTKLQATVEKLAQQVTAGLGLEMARLYTKDQFLAAMNCGAQYWKDLLKDPDFKLTILGTKQTPQLYGEDYLRFLKRRKERNEADEGRDSEA